MLQKTAIAKTLNKSWSKLEKVLHRKGVKTAILDSERALRRFIYENIPDNCIVALSNSLSSRTLKIRNILLEKGNKVYYNWNGTAPNRILETFDEQPSPDYFLTTAETITEDGNIVDKEFSREAMRKKNLPKNIIAFSLPEKLLNQFTYTGLSSDFTIINNQEQSRLTVALLS